MLRLKRGMDLKKYNISTRQDILNIAAPLFKEHGYDGTTLKMISDKLGLAAHSVIAHHFKNKRGVVKAILDEFVHSIREYIRGIMPEDTNEYTLVCIEHIYICREVMSIKNKWRVFYHDENIALWKELSFIEDEYRAITKQFQKGFTEEEIRMAALMDLAARLRLLEEHDQGRLTCRDFCYYLSYLIGIHSRLDEATIQKNIKLAFEIADKNVPAIHFL